MLDAALAVEKPLEIEVCQSKERTNKTELIVLKGGFSTSDHSYEFEIISEGTGEIFYSDFLGDAEEFAYGIKVEKLAREIEEAICEQIALQSEENEARNGRD